MANSSKMKIWSVEILNAPCSNRSQNTKQKHKPHILNPNWFSEKRTTDIPVCDTIENNKFRKPIINLIFR